MRVRNHGNAVEFTCAFGDSLENSIRFGANGEAVGCVLDVTAGEDPALIVLDSRVKGVYRVSPAAFSSAFGIINVRV